jgi:hypothetical protein
MSNIKLRPLQTRVTPGPGSLCKNAHRVQDAASYFNEARLTIDSTDGEKLGTAIALEQLD